MSGRLDDEKLETLRRWGAGLSADGRDELRAAGKAILILIEEIERLQVDVWHTLGASRGQLIPGLAGDTEPAPAAPRAAPPKKPTLEEVAEEFLAGRPQDGGLEPTLRRRLRRILPARHVKIE